jgi:tRNA pseudouridine38-40 synthase
MATFKLTISYDGTHFVGWQRQAEGVSIQGLLEEALVPFEGGPVAVHGAGRTDAGVHALGQVASVALTSRHSAHELLRGLNACLPKDVRVVRVEAAAPEFHARFAARSKMYRYWLETAPIASPFHHRYAWHVAQPLDLDAMAAGAAALIGTHDFAAFRSTGSETMDAVRTITRSEIIGDPAGTAVGVDGTALLAYEISGNGFLRHMVRAIVGTLVEIGRGARSVSSIASLLAGGNRGDAGATAPPHGLFLVRVDYD